MKDEGRNQTTKTDTMLVQTFLSVASLLLLTSTNGFVLKDSSSRCKCILQASDPASADTVQDEQRRNVFLTSALAVVGAASSTLLNNDSLLDGSLSRQVTGMTAGNQLQVDQALEIIENQCDKRFLHAVVASDYHLLYQMAPSNGQVSVLRTDQDMSVLKSTMLTPADLEIIDAKLKDRPMQVDSSCQLAFAKPQDVPLNAGEKDVVSIWPLGEQVHFTWMEQKTSLASINADDKIIVDGIDCGRMSLEDALEEGKQVLLRSETYLSVPRSLEKDLVAKLRNAFLI